VIETSSRLMYQDGVPVGVQGIARDVSERKRMEERLNYLAFHDDLTGLPNRPLFHDRLSQALKRAEKEKNEVVVMLLDIDRFKEINDTLGHDTGDRLLQAVAHRLSVDVRLGDTMARTSGDEFFFVFSGIENQEAAQAAASRIQDAFGIPFLVDGNEFYITPSIGVSRYPQDGHNAENMIKSAEMAMYSAKELGKNNHQFFTPELGTAAADKRTLEYQLRKAIEKEEFEVYYQPQVELRTGRLIGCEALLRWRHPERGLLAPAHFMGVAEENGFIIPIGEWVLRKACAQNKAWQNEGLPPIRMAVNLSARQFHLSQKIQKDLITTVSQALEESKLSPTCLELEITESIAMRNIEDTIRTLAQLHELGVRLSIDDFGTGYSSLAYLKKFPIDALKVDRAFVKDVIEDPDDAAIVEAILAMARSLKLHAIAEGVEKESQLKFLHALGCDEVQGYYFSKPIPADSFRNFLLRPLMWKQ
jgi:diguanylate cyclase (GGDEF)-like protein